MHRCRNDVDIRGDTNFVYIRRPKAPRLTIANVFAAIQPVDIIGVTRCRSPDKAYYGTAQTSRANGENLPDKPPPGVISATFRASSDNIRAMLPW